MSERRSYQSSGPAFGRTIQYAKFYDEELGEEEAVKRLTGDLRDVERRLNLIAETILRLPKHRLGHLEIPDHFSGLEASHDIERRFNHLDFRIRPVKNALADQAILSLRRKEAALALRNIKALRRVRYVHTPSFLFGSVISNRSYSKINEIIWEGLRLRRWSAKDLDKLERLIESREPIIDGVEAYKGELALAFRIAPMAPSFLRQAYEADEVTNRPLTEKLSRWSRVHGPEGWETARSAECVSRIFDFLLNPQDKRG